MDLCELTYIVHKDEIKDLIRAAFSEEPCNDRWDDEEKFEQYVLDIAGNANSLTLGLYDDENLVAISVGRLKHWYDGIEYWIDDLCVLPSCQGRGVGTALLHEIRQYAAEHKFKEISLLTRRNTYAFCFYEKNGWKCSDEWVKFSVEK